FYVFHSADSVRCHVVYRRTAVELDGLLREFFGAVYLG
ncbi:uncharacterized protein METZ01_LOCUS218667, partial [marine metagenome]